MSRTGVCSLNISSTGAFINSFGLFIGSQIAMPYLAAVALASRRLDAKFLSLAWIAALTIYTWWKSKIKLMIVIIIN